MQIESEQPIDDLIETDASVEETYHLLYEGMAEMLADAPGLYEPQNTDYFMLLNDKVNYSAGQADAKVAKLESARSEMHQMVFDAFRRDYAEFIDDYELEELKSPQLARLIYNIFYFGKYGTLVEFLVNIAISNRKALVEQFKKDSKKDLIHTRLKLEFPDMKNPANLQLIVHYQEIAVSALTSNVQSFDDLLNRSNLSFSQHQRLLAIFGNVDGPKLFLSYINKLTEHPNYNHFVTDFRDALVKQLMTVS